MITYVNTVFVANDSTKGGLAEPTNQKLENLSVSTDAKKFVILDVDSNLVLSTTAHAGAANRIKIGYITDKTTVVNGTTIPVIKWSNIINKHDVKSFTSGTYAADSEDTIDIDFTGIDQNLLTEFAKGGKRIVVRLTFKDLPTRYRKWTESYEYITKPGDDAGSIATGIAALINGDSGTNGSKKNAAKRARVIATATDQDADSTTNPATEASYKVTLEAMPYDDDDAVDTLNWANKVRFNANVYWTDPAGEGWESLNKHFPTGVSITKTPGEAYPASWKLVRDREAQAMGYEGILNRGMGTWPIIRPAMNTIKDGEYNYAVLEFENMYRAADDIFRKTKQTVEAYGIKQSSNSAISGLVTFLTTFAA